MRRISLPPTVDEDACSADFENGVLKITLPVSEKKARGRKIELGSGKSASSKAGGTQTDREHDKAPAAKSGKPRAKAKKKD